MKEGGTKAPPYKVWLSVGRGLAPAVWYIPVSASDAAMRFSFLFKGFRRGYGENLRPP
ncbi:MAG: hypothetical protein J6U87_00900 [Clostridia bacterium]|nr:hypothetical protein [Clostridia bacterium]